jgi:hypothetical protein
MQLSTILLEKNQKSTSGIIANLTLNISQTKWVLHSSATDHMTGNKYLLYNFRKCEIDQYVTVANEKKIKILGYGSIYLFSKEISNILFVQNYTSNLLSINKIAHELNYEVIFSSKKYDFSRINNKKGNWQRFS